MVPIFIPQWIYTTCCVDVAAYARAAEGCWHVWLACGSHCPCALRVLYLCGACAVRVRAELMVVVLISARCIGSFLLWFVVVVFSFFVD